MDTLNVEHGFTWDQMGCFQLVDGINMPTLMDDGLLLSSGNTVTAETLLENREYCRQGCGTLNFASLSSDSIIKHANSKQYGSHLTTSHNSNCTTNHTQILGSQQSSFASTEYNSNSYLHSTTETQVHPSIRGNSSYSISYLEGAQSSKKDTNRRKRTYNSQNRGHSGNTAVNNMQGHLEKSASVKGRSKKVRETLEDYTYSKMYVSSGECSSQGISGVVTEDLSSIKYYEGFKLPLGDLGRKMLLKKLREIHTQNPTKMEKALTDHGLSYTRIRFASVQQLFKISYVCDVFDYALSIHCEFGRPRHRDSTKAANLSTNNIQSNAPQSSAQVSTPASSPAGSDLSNIIEPYEGSASMNESSIIKISSKPNSIGEVELNSRSPNGSPCSYSSYTSGINEYCQDHQFSSKTPLTGDKGIYNDPNSPMSIFTASYTPPMTNKKRLEIGSVYNFSPPPIPVAASTVEDQTLCGDSSKSVNEQNTMQQGNGDIISVNKESQFLSNLNCSESTSNLIANSTIYNDEDRTPNLYGVPHALNASQFIPRIHSSVTSKYEDFSHCIQEISSNKELGSLSLSSSVVKPITKRQRLKSKRKYVDKNMGRSELVDSLTENYPVDVNVLADFVTHEYGLHDVTASVTTPYHILDIEDLHLGAYESSADQNSSIYSGTVDINEGSACCLPYGTSLVLSTTVDINNIQHQEISGDSLVSSFYVLAQQGTNGCMDEVIEPVGYVPLSEGIHNVGMFHSVEMDSNSIDLGCQVISI
ncbi:hypothetical protein ACR3K2_01820 [Cryptosporidium serpentis]